jgi:hypothetical protein
LQKNHDVHKIDIQSPDLIKNEILHMGAVGQEFINRAIPAILIITIPGFGFHHPAGLVVAFYESAFFPFNFHASLDLPAWNKSKESFYSFNAQLVDVNKIPYGTDSFDITEREKLLLSALISV